MKLRKCLISCFVDMLVIHIVVLLVLILINSLILELCEFNLHSHCPFYMKKIQYGNLHLTCYRKRVFILGPSHHVYLPGCAVTGTTVYNTPLYNLKIDTKGISLSVQILWHFT